MASMRGIAVQLWSRFAELLEAIRGTGQHHLALTRLCLEVDPNEGGSAAATARVVPAWPISREISGTRIILPANQGCRKPSLQFYV